MLASSAWGQAATSADVQRILGQLAEQQKTIQTLQTALAEQQKKIEQLQGLAPAQIVQIAAAAPVSVAAPVPAAAPVAAAPSQTLVKPQETELSKAVTGLTRSIAGFRLSGDMRLRFDLQSRAANAVAGPLQNARGRYRLRLNFDRDFFGRTADRSMARFHLQLATAPMNNPLTMDTDFTGIDTRAPISVSEAWVDLTPTRNLSFRAGRTSEVFADNSQYVFDDDVRFNGFHEAYRLAGKGSAFLEVKAGQYILTNPNTPIVPAGSPYLNAGYNLGQRVPSAGMFDQGIVVGSNLGKKWRQSWTGNYIVMREANQLQLASTAAGFAVLTSPEFGAALTSPLPQPGNATTTPGGAIYSAERFRIIRGAFQLNYAGREFMGHNVPLRLFVQGTRNTGARIERDGFAAGVTLGQATRAGDVLFQYGFLYKPANAFASQLTDDDVGTGVGVNLRTHAIRLDFGLARWVTWENRLYIQNPIAGNNPAANFFVPQPRGMNTTVRLQSQFNFTF